MKKQFVQPEIKVVEIDETQIICDSEKFGIPDGTGYEPENW